MEPPWGFGLLCKTFNIKDYIRVAGEIENTGRLQKKGAVSKVDKTFISRPTRAQHTLSAARTVLVSRTLQQFASHA
jgi:hypothetical protein